MTIAIFALWLIVTQAPRFFELVQSITYQQPKSEIGCGVKSDQSLWGGRATSPVASELIVGREGCVTVVGEPNSANLPTTPRRFLHLPCYLNRTQPSIPKRCLPLYFKQYWTQFTGNKWEFSLIIKTFPNLKSSSWVPHQVRSLINKLLNRKMGPIAFE